MAYASLAAPGRGGLFGGVTALAAGMGLGMLSNSRAAPSARCQGAAATLQQRLAAAEQRLAALEGRSGALPRLQLGGVARVPAQPVLMRERPGTGIGQRTRFIADPAERARAFPHSNDDIPATLAPPRDGFPLLAQPADGAPGKRTWTLQEWARASRATLDAELRARGAVLLHGLPIATAADFNAFVLGLGYPPMDTHGASERQREAEVVFGASDDVPPSHTLHPHNEQAYLGSGESPSYPRKLFFCCLREPASGGETPVVCNRAVTADIRRERPELWARLRAHGVKYVQTLKSGSLDDPMSENLGGEQTWQKAFNTTERAEVERQCAARGYELEWTADSPPAAVLSSTRQATVPEWRGAEAAARAVASEEGGVRDVWFNQASNVFSFVPHYGDGGPLEDDTLEYLNAVYWRNAVAFRWSAGDVLAVDNEMAMHARTSFEAPRKIVVGFSRE
eukprot:g263.t1